MNIISSDLIYEAIDHEHSRLVSRIAGLLAEKARFSGDEVMMIESTALLHDIGKFSIPNSILLKPSKLTGLEYKIIQSHVLAGSKDILRTLKILLASFIVALQHHERIDGAGYAQVTNIHSFAKVVAVADVFEALIAKNRPYKEPWPPEMAVSYMRDNSGKQFEAEYITALLESLDEIRGLYESDRVKKE